MGKRIEWIDIAKGIAILAVVIGHTLGPYNGQFFGSLIFAFHMPIFFMLSGYLYHPRSVQQECRRGVINLLLPYLATAVVLLTLSAVARCLPNPLLNAYFASWRRGLIATLYGAGSEVFNPWHWQVQPIGAVWFLLSMFIAMQLFNGVMLLTAHRHQQLRQAVVRGGMFGIFAILGGWLGQVVYLPWAVNAALLAQVFLYVGYLVRQNDLLSRMSPAWYLLFTFMWLVSAFQGYFALTVPTSPNLLISIMGGIAGSLCIIRISDWFSHYPNAQLVKWLKHYGQLSLVVLCFHLVDLNVIGIEGWLTSHLMNHMGPLVTTIIGISYRIGFVTVAMLTIPHLPGIRACFLPRQYLFRRVSHR